MATEICSVYGDIEARIADYFIADARASRIEVKDFPRNVRKTNDAKARVRFAILFSSKRTHRLFVLDCDRANRAAGLMHRANAARELLR